MGGCYRSEYRDDFDIMGGAYSAHFNGAQKQRLGWIDNRVVDLTRGGSTRLTPLEKTTGQVAARIGVVNPRGRLRVYRLEYRHNIGFDALPPEATDGVLVHVEDVDSNLDDGTSLLDARPGGPPSICTATLRAGESWTTPEGVTIAVTAVQASGADVSVTADAELPGGSFTGVDPCAGSTPGPGSVSPRLDRPRLAGRSCSPSAVVAASPRPGCPPQSST